MYAQLLVKLLKKEAYKWQKQRLIECQETAILISMKYVKTSN
jgi:hypothetical protein